MYKNALSKLDQNSIKYTALFFSSLLLFFSHFSAFAQTEQLIKQENSPYSYFGLGDITSNGHAINRAMGYVGIALTDPQSVNFINPASLGSMRYAAIQSGSFLTSHNLKNSLSSSDPDYINNSFNISIPYLTLNFPVRERYNLAVGLMPYSRTSYNLVNEIQNTTLPDSSNLERKQLLGFGELYTLYIGNGYQTKIAKGGPWKYWQLAGGFNATYYFGSRTKQLITSFPEIGDILGLRRTQSVRLRDFGMSYGIILSRIFYEETTNSLGTRSEKEKNRISLGLTYEKNNNIRSQISERWESIYFNIANQVIVVDTNGYFVEDSLGSVSLPTKLGAALNLRLKKRITFELDYTRTNWEELTIFNESESLLSSNKLNFGFSVQPKITFSNLKSVWRRSTYMFGAYYDDGYIETNDGTISDFGFTFGVKFSVFQGFQAKKLVNVNLAFNVGSRGNTNGNNIRDTYFRSTLGLTFNDANWFKKRKYN